MQCIEQKNIETKKDSTPESSQDNQKSWSDLNVHTYIKTAIIAGLIYFVFRNEIVSIVSKWTDPSWSHGILIPLFSLYFLNQNKNEILQLNTKPNYLGLVFLVMGLVFYPLNIVHFHFGYLNSICVIGVMGAVVLFLGGWKLVKYTWLPITYLIFAIPLPHRMYVQITMPMRKLAAQVASVLLSLADSVQATANGVVIDVIHNGTPMEPPLNVAEACSGMRLLMAFMALGVAMAYLHYRPIWQRLVLLASTIPIAIFCNMVRVTITGFIYILGNPKYAQGIYHDLLGMLMLPLAFGLYSGMAWFMSSLFLEEEETEKQPEPEIIVRRTEKKD